MSQPSSGTTLENTCFSWRWPGSDKLSNPHILRSLSPGRIAVFGKGLSRIGGARGWQAGGAGGESVRDSRSEELTEWYRSFGDAVKREDPGDSLIQCVD